ncbi:hypothetical protein [Streptomyces abyssomicinicus]|uniref:hypothetical protein n=1 Tax=Streptomyces abyssomicinicus TaxID=574929 RepID=UPI00124F99FE|nr:hypothetical protein [Streptomyces abyssomicinicus]
MSRLNVAELAATAAVHIQTADAVRRDPAVVKAAKQFAEDGIQAIRSGKVFLREVQCSWRRNSPANLEDGH